MSTPFYSVETATATQFTYSYNNISPQITALTLTGFGQNFTYSGPLSDVQTGYVENAEVSLSFLVDVPGVGVVENTYTYQLVYGINRGVVSILNDPEFAGAEIREVLEEDAMFLEPMTNQDLLDLFTFDAAGLIIDGPNPTIIYNSVTGPVTGTAIADDLSFEGTGGRVDTLGGDDIVYFGPPAAQTELRATLRAGDDVFYVDDGFSFGGAEDPAASTTWVNGGAGSDILFGGSGEDLLRGFNDNDLLVGKNGQDRLLGGGGDDEIYGGFHRDVIFAGSGRDIIDGGLGDDVASGGLGRDVFIFDITNNIDFLDPGSTGEADVIQDFAVGLDYLHFRQFGNDMTHPDAFAIFDANSMQVGADTVFSYLGGSITLRNTTKADFTVDSFYDKPWQLPGEFDYFDRLNAVLDGLV